MWCARGSETHRRSRSGITFRRWMRISRKRCGVVQKAVQPAADDKGQELTIQQQSPSKKGSEHLVSTPVDDCPTAPVSREGLEPSTSGLTYRPGIHPPYRSGLDITISLGRAGREPLVKSLRIPAADAADLSC